MKIKRILAGVVVVAVVVLAGGWWFASHRTHVSRETSDQLAATENLSDPALIAKGHYLALAGDCVACHTQPGGQPFTGGRELATPFGNIPSPNLTPDDATGLGKWKFADFWQALHDGKGLHGEFLYPVFSYTSYTKVTRDDALAIFAYLKSLKPIHVTPKSLGMAFPYDVRSSLAGWRALYFKEGVYQPDPAQSAEWNRGAYLVQGLGHCNECHAARTPLGGTASGPTLSGGQIPVQDWYAPDLSTKANGGLAGWSTQDIVDLLKTGQSSRGAAFGPMTEVVEDSTQHMTDADLHAIATYLQSLPPRVPEKSKDVAIDEPQLVALGSSVYQEHCAACHGDSGNGVTGMYPPLNGNSAVVEPTGINAIRVVLLGGFAPSTKSVPRPFSMPPFAQELTDNEVAAVVTYIRQAWGNKAPPIQVRDVSRYRQTPID